MFKTRGLVAEWERVRCLALVTACLAVVVAAPLACASGNRSASPLEWSPPPLVAPTTIMLPTTSTHLELRPDRDYILKFPPAGVTGAVWIEGGHNIVMIGGRITVPSTANQRDNGADNSDTGIYIKNVTGTVHIEGVEITGQPDVMFDGIDINAPNATVQIENVRVSGLYGSTSLMHADAVQTWGGVRQLLIDRLSVDGDYQGLTIDPDLGPVGTVVIENTDLTINSVPAPLASESSGGGHMIWLTKGTHTCEAPSSTVFDHVYVDAWGSLGLTPADVVWPQATHTSLPCTAKDQGGRLTWPTLPVVGAVTLGAPPGGPFVPQGAVGANYQSPGYMSQDETTFRRMPR